MELNELMKFDEIKFEQFYNLLLERGLVCSDIDEVDDHYRLILWNLYLTIKLV